MTDKAEQWSAHLRWPVSTSDDQRLSSQLTTVHREGKLVWVWLHLHIIYSLYTYSTGFKYIENINATAPQRNVLKYIAIFKNVAHSLEPGETPSYSASHQAPNYVQSS